MHAFNVVNKPLMIVFYFHSPGPSVEVPNVSEILVAVVVSRPVGANDMEACMLLHQ